MLRKLSESIAGQLRYLKARNRVHAERPHLNIFRSLRNMYVQIVNDQTGVILAEVSTLDKELRDRVACGGMIYAAKAAGEAIAKQALAKGITKVVFDGAGYMDHGRVAALATAARAAGLEF